MFEIQIKSPTRVDLAGGTLDCWPLYLFLNNPITVNVAIDIFTYADLREHSDSSIELSSTDLAITKTYRDLPAALADTEPAFDMVRAHLRYWRPKHGFSLATRSESPIGGGLGGSSSLCISLLRAFSAWLKTPLEVYDMVRLASHLEAQVLLKPTGTQDYFPAIAGGLNQITYGARGPEVEVHAIDRELFDRRFLLVYTGRSHHSGINNWQVIKNWLDGAEQTRRVLSQLAEISADMKDVLRQRQFSRLPSLFEREYAARTDISSGFSSPEIRRLAELASSEGALAKICGAGGGGCVLIWCPDQQIDAVAKLVRANGFETLSAKPWEQEI